MEEVTSTMDNVTSTVTQAREQTDRLVRDNPATAALVMFSVGCCLGVLTTMLAFPPMRRPEPHWYDSMWPR